MHVDYTAEQKELRLKLRDYFSQLMTPERRDGIRALEGGKLFREIVREMGSDGWLGVGWPEEYGGGGMTAVEQLIFFDELRRAGAPLPFVTLNTVGPALMSHGSEAHKREFLPRILAGEAHFAIGYTEPDAGTDLASLKTAAVKDGDEWVINGTKIFTSGADDADYIWLAARTDPEAKKHKGITMFIIDTQIPGFSAAPIHTVGGGHTCMSYYENVRVHESMIVGGLNQGWRLITTQLNHERIGLAAFGGIAFKHLDDVVHWAGETLDSQGNRLIDDPRVQTALGEASARLEAMKVMNWRMAWGLEMDILDPAQASAVKVYSTETLIEVYRLLQEVVGVAGALRKGSLGAVLLGALSQEARACQINTFGGGVNEVQREIIAMAGLGMPRAPR
ncbi:MAG: acyl-CoA dehydrogenase family protein [Myxococcota bacterium]|nr:acyl-CoA dehydrogenase family protein [Myxococcota bacterium]